VSQYPKVPAVLVHPVYLHAAEFGHVGYGQSSGIGQSPVHVTPVVYPIKKHVKSPRCMQVTPEFTGHPILLMHIHAV
jgi:hypothetical protein